MPVIHVKRFERLRCEGQRPMGYEMVCLPEQRFPNLASRTMGPTLAQRSGQSPLAVVRLERHTDEPPIETMTARLDLRDECCKLAVRSFLRGSLQEHERTMPGKGSVGH